MIKSTLHTALFRSIQSFAEVSRRSLAVAMTLSLLILGSGCATQQRAAATIPAGPNVAKVSGANTIPAGPGVAMPGDRRR
jgi:hypothetical protein